MVAVEQEKTLTKILQVKVATYIRPSTAKRVYDHFLFNVTREEIKNLVEDEFSCNTMKNNE